MELPIKERLHWLAVFKEQFESVKERFIHEIGGLHGINGTLLKGENLCWNYFVR